MFEIRVESCFHATHAVFDASGSMEPPHEHHWKVTLILRGEQLNDHGFLVDFCATQERLQRILAQLEGSNLNQNPRLDGIIPTAEHLARLAFELLAPLSWSPGHLAEVMVQEAEGFAASYSEKEVR